jgi:hypothetical protein
MGVGGEGYAPAALHPGKEIRYAFYWELGGLQGRYGGMRKITTPRELDPRNLQPVASDKFHINYVHSETQSYSTHIQISRLLVSAFLSSHHQTISSITNCRV